MWKVYPNTLVTFCLFIMAPIGPAVAVTHYVNPGMKIQAAIDASSNGDEIEVAPGMYPGAINFNGKAVRLYSSGGRFSTTIDGSGCLHVVQCVSGEGAGTILEGFTIMGGNAQGSGGPDFNGGGMLNSGSSPTVRNCIFFDNTADYGGGMYNRNRSNPTVTNCTFDINTARVWGGGMYNYANHPSVNNCTFSDNNANDGGGILNERCNLEVTNCTFSGNEADNGGGIFNQISHPTVNNCMFSGNEASDGGGMLNLGSNPTVTNCTFNGNTADYSSGGMYNDNSNPKVTNCTFSNNESRNGGGMLNSTLSNPTLINCTFSGNTASDAGGGMYNRDSGPTVRNCTFTGNTASWGGGMLNFRNWPRLTNCILWGDIPNEIFDIETSSSLYYCDIEGGWSGSGDNNIDADPCFVNASSGDLRLSTPASPCVDTGDSTILLGEQIYLDLDLKIRYVDIESVINTGYGPLEFLDMGAYEFNCNYTAGDSNCDGVVDFKDLGILGNNWLAGAGSK